jgi:hypothetical protein
MTEYHRHYRPMMASLAFFALAACSCKQSSVRSSPPLGGSIADGTGGTGDTHLFRDPQGWTVVTPSSDSRLIYVSSSSGNDTTGNYVLASSIPSGTARDGLPSGVTPVATFAKARTFLRPGYPDWMLLRSGDTWHEILGAGPGGRSASEPMIITSYEKGRRPILQPDPASGSGIISHNGATVTSNLSYIGLEFYDARKDPSSPNFVHDGAGKASGPDITAFFWNDGSDNILVEDCFMHFMASGLTIQDVTGPAPANWTIRRNIIVDMYELTGRGQGIFTGGVNGMVIEENIFDHNAWNDAAGVPAGIFDHHLYLTRVFNTLVRKNLFLRAESLSVKCPSGDIDEAHDNAYDNNFFFEGEVGLNLGFQTGSHGTVPPGGGSAHNRISITNNVFSQIDRDNPTGRGLGWGLDMTTAANLSIRGNIFSDFSLGSVNRYAIYLTSNGHSTADSSDVMIEDNILYGIGAQNVILEPQASWARIVVRNNAIQDAGLGSQMQTVGGTGSFTALTYSGNRYSAANDANFGKVLTATKNYAQWLTASGETGSSVQTIAYPDPSRTLDRYVATLNPAWTLADFYAAIRTQSKAKWHPEYMAPSVNNYIRAGFGLAAIKGP